jgi:hypothetical protein
VTGDRAACLAAMAGSAESGGGTVRGSGLIIVRAGEGSERETGGGGRLLCAAGAAAGSDAGEEAFGAAGAGDGRGALTAAAGFRCWCARRRRTSETTSPK